MNRIQKKYIQERFIPALAQLGYALKQADNEQLLFNTRNNLHFILYVRKEVVQGFYICGKRMLSVNGKHGRMLVCQDREMTQLVLIKISTQSTRR